MQSVQPPRGVWLSSDDYAKSELGQRLCDQIRDIFGHIFTFNDLDLCENFIRNESCPRRYERIFLIVHGDFLSSLINHNIHHLRLIEAIFVYNQNQIIYGKKYDKVIVVHETKDLLVALSKSVDRFSTQYGALISRLKQSDPDLTANIINNFADYSELWYPLFLDLLFDLPPITTIGDERNHHINEFLTQCRRFFLHDPALLSQVDHFLDANNDSYTSETAIKHYTKDSFLHKRVNKALRQQNFQAILDMRFFLYDIDHLLREAYKEFGYLYFPGDQMVFYRGQSMTNEEIKVLQEKRRHGSLITSNSYLSTTMIRDLGIKFARSHPNRELSPILIKITAEYRDPTLFRRKPFASIAHLSQFKSAEAEVLFSMGSFFRLDNFSFDTLEHIHIFELTFIYDEDHLTITDDFNALRQGSVEDKLLKIGRLLSIQSQQKSIKSQAFYQRFLDDQHPSSIHAACYTGLGWLAFEQYDLLSAITYQEKALEWYHKDLNVPNSLYGTSYNGLGAIYAHERKYSKALSYYLKAYEISPQAIPIDKYAFFNSFLNNSSVNIACMYKIQGYIDKAWSTYQTILATEMRNFDRFHAAIYLKIAEAGLTNYKTNQTSDEQMENFENWKRFLDFSLTDMSSSYRRSIVSGVLSIGFRFGNHERTRDMAIDYYKQIIRISQRFMDCSSSDYSIVLQCYQTIARLYCDKTNFTASISYAVDGIKLCWRHDSSSILEFYSIMIKTYEKQLQTINSDHSPIDIAAKLIIDHSRMISESSLSPEIILYFERDEFTFGEYRKMLNPHLIHEYNYKRCLAHCLLKAAVLKYELHQVDGLEETLYRVPSLLPNIPEIITICNNNLAYVRGDYDQIMNQYRTNLDEKLSKVNNEQKCVNEDGFCYIGHLLEKKGQLDESEYWYKKAIDHFLEHRHLCSHTRSCFIRMASFYERRTNLIAAITTYQRYIYYLQDNNPDMTEFQRNIIVLIEEMFIHSNNNHNNQLLILKKLILCILQSSPLVMNEKILSIIQIIQKTHSEHGSIVKRFYESYLRILLTYDPSFMSNYVPTLIEISRPVMDTYEQANDMSSIYELYQRMIFTILKYPNDWHQITVFIKRIPLELEVKHHLQTALAVYQALYRFIYKHPAQSHFQDTNLLIYILERCQLLVDRDRLPIILIYPMKIDMLETYWRTYPERVNCDIKWVTDRLNTFFIKLAKSDPTLTRTYYDRLLALSLQYQSEKFDEQLTMIVENMHHLPADLLQLLTKYHLNYMALIRWVCKSKSQGSDHLPDTIPTSPSSYLNTIMSSYVKKAKRCGNTEKCWNDCLYYLLEQCSKQDAYFAECYLQLGDPVQAANVFDPTIYKTIALMYCSNACRRYLTYVYSGQLSNEELFHKFSDHFYFVDGQRTIRPLEPSRMS